jgi:hypothetical protein
LIAQYVFEQTVAHRISRKGSDMRKLLSGVALVLLALGVAATDFYLQARKHAEGFGGPQYVASMIDRFDGGPGMLALMFRKSSMITPALPPTPPGWTAHVWSSVPYDGLYSDTQWAVLDQQYNLATSGQTLLISNADEYLHDAYNDDISRVYLGHGGAYIDFYIEVDGIDMPREILRLEDSLIESHYDRVDRITSHATIQGITWYERRGPVETASNDRLPHKLRMFEADLGNVEISMITRAPDDMLRRFMEEIDLTDLRHINSLPTDNLIMAMTYPPENRSAQEARASMADRPVAQAGSNRAVVVQRGGGCSAGVFC